MSNVDLEDIKKLGFKQIEQDGLIDATNYWFKNESINPNIFFIQDNKEIQQTFALVYNIHHNIISLIYKDYIRAGAPYIPFVRNYPIDDLEDLKKLLKKYKLNYIVK
jgi:hypothetical protein